MTAIIHASEKPLWKIFCDDYAISIPNYQRSYSWGVDRTLQLLEDVNHFAGKASLTPYFLGSIVFIKKPGIPDAQVIDGQQRLITLTILFASLRYLLGERGKALSTLIRCEGNPYTGTQERMRIRVRERDQDFFDTYIQREDGLQTLPRDLDLPDSQANVRSNALELLKRLKNDFALDECDKLAKYLAQACYMVTVETSDQESAYRIFSVLNTSGLQLSHADILKAETIGALPSSAQDAYTAKWEEMEVRLGLDEFRNVFEHIRMIKRRDKARESVLEEIRKYLEPAKDPGVFIDTFLMPLASAYDTVINWSFEAKKHADDINGYLRWMNKLDNDDWIPPAMSALARWGGSDTDRLVIFLRRLERLAFSSYVRRTNVNERIKRYARVLEGIEGDEDPRKRESGLGLTAAEKSEVIEALSGDVYNQKFRLYLLLRLDDHLAAGGARYDYPIISVEHVLPQNPESSSEWLDLFDDDQREDLTHCLGNLLLLPRRKNAEARNFAFQKKKDKYFSKEGSSPFVLTTQVLKSDRWTPELVQQRRTELIEKCRELWNL